MNSFDQFRFHLLCAITHTWKAGSALWCSRARELALWILAGTFAILFFAGCASPGGKRWYAPATWFSHAPAAAADKAHEDEKKADTVADSASDKVIHSAHVEIVKASLAAQSLPASRASELTKRFLGNGLSLIDQLDQLNASEWLNARPLVADLLSENAATVAAAEQKQAAAESEASRLSRELTTARADAAAATLRADSADAKVRAAFDRENALANDLRAQHARFWLAIGALVLVSGFALYAKLALGGVGAALHAAGAPASVIQALDSRLSTFGQYLIRTGRHAAAKAEAVLATQLPPAP